MSISNVFARLTFAVLGIWITRFLGPAEAGLFFSAYAYVNVYAAMPDFGVSPLVLRQSAREPDRVSLYYGGGISVFIVFGLSVYAVIVGISFLLAYQPVVRYLIAILAFVIIARSGEQIANTALQLKQRLHITAAIQFTGAIVSIALVYAAAQAGGNVIDISWILASVAIGAAILLLLSGIRICRPRLQADIFRYLIIKSRPFGIAGFVSNLYVWGPPIALSWLASESAVGQYSAAFRLISFALILPHVLFNQVFMPSMFAWAHGDSERLRTAFITASKYMAMLGVGAGVGLAVLRSEIIGLVYGEVFMEAAPLLAVLAGALAFRYFSCSLSTLLTVSDNLLLRIRLQFIALAVMAVLALVLVPRWGMMGAAWTTFGTELALAGGYSIGCARSFYRLKVMKDLRLHVIGVAGLVMAILLLALAPFVAVAGLVVLGAVAYVAMLVPLQFFDEEDRRLVRLMIHNRAQRLASEK